MLTRGEGVTVKRFGGEGTRGRSYLTYGWKVGHTYQLKVNARSDANESDKVVFTGWFLIPELNIWRLLAPFQVRPTAARKKLENLHRFLKIGLEVATAVRTCVVQQGSGQTVVLGCKLHTEEAQPQSQIPKTEMASCLITVNIWVLLLVDRHCQTSPWARIDVLPPVFHLFYAWIPQQAAMELLPASPKFPSSTSESLFT